MPQVTSLIIRFKAGSSSAYQALFTHYFPGLVSAARRHLDPRLACPTDPEDLALSAFLGLWQETNQGRLANGLTDRDSLLRALSLLVAQKARRALRHAFQHKRDARRTLHSSTLLRHGHNEWTQVARAAADPVQQTLFRETLREALALLTPLQRAIVELKLAGHTNPEIATTLGRALRSIERQLSEIRSRWGARQFFGVDLPD